MYADSLSIPGGEYKWNQCRGRLVWEDDVHSLPFQPENMPMERFLGKVALCVGATQGIGLAAARRLAQEQCKVVVNSRRQENVDEAVDTLRKEGLEVSGVAGNSRLSEDRTKIIEYACEKYGGVDGAFLSAGVSPHFGDFLTVTEEHWDRAFDTNVKAHFQFIQELVPVMEKRGGGTIVTNSTASVYGLIASLPAQYLQLYVVSKTAQVALTKHLSRPLIDKNIRINCVAPGAIQTKFLEGGLDEGTFDRYWKVAGYKKGDLGTRVGTPEEISSIVAFLMSDDSSYVTGNCIIASGGYVLHRHL